MRYLKFDFMGPHSCHLSESGFSGQFLRILIHKNRQRSRPNLSQTKILDPSCIETSRTNPIQILYFVNQKTSDLKKKGRLCKQNGPSHT